MWPVEPLALRVIRLQRQFARRLALENGWPGTCSSEDFSKYNHSFGTGPAVPDRSLKELQNDLGGASGYAFPVEIFSPKGFSYAPFFWDWYMNIWYFWFFSALPGAHTPWRAHSPPISWYTISCSWFSCLGRQLHMIQGVFIIMNMLFFCHGGIHHFVVI